VFISLATEIANWKSHLGKYVKTKQHLIDLIQNGTYWSQVNLDVMVKTAIETQLHSFSISGIFSLILLIVQ
jgi:hypothetical protein